MTHRMTFGYELELGDVRRELKVPAHLGTWEYAETDIVNIHPPYAGVACDPSGLEPPVGGEINIMPGRTTMEVADRVAETIEWFRSQGDNPSASCVNHGHVHVRVLGLRDDIDALKRLTAYIKRNQRATIDALYGYEELPEMAQCKTARTYLKWDGGRPMPDWMADNIINLAENFDDFIRIQCCGKDGVSRGRPFRYAVNTYCMKHTDTIEFRCLRASLEHRDILGSLVFAHDFIEAALNCGEDVPQLLERHAYSFPPFIFNLEHYLGWERTKWPKERGEKRRILREL